MSALPAAGDQHPWLALSFADYGFLVGKPNARQLYRDMLSNLDPFAVHVARRQVELFSKLGILAKSVEAVAPLFATPPGPNAGTQQLKVLLFTGRRIDNPDRPNPRFPAHKEATARQAIRQAVTQE